MDLLGPELARDIVSRIRPAPVVDSVNVVVARL